MPNTILTPTAVTREALRILHQKLNFVGSINRKYDSSFAKEGAKIGTDLRIRLPNQYLVTDGATLSMQDTIESSVTLQVNKQKHVGLVFTSQELTLSLDDFSSRVLDPAMTELAAVVEADAMTMFRDCYYSIWNGGSTASYNLALDGRVLLQRTLTPAGNRTANLNPKDMADVVKDTKTLFNDQKEVGSQYKEGYMGRAAGFDWMENTMWPAHTRGAGASYVCNTSTGITNGSATITVSGGTGALNVGDVFTIADVFRVHPETKQSTGILQQFVVTAAASTGATSISVSPTPFTSTTDARQNVTLVSAGASKALTFAGTASTAVQTSLLYHKDAFTFATADLVMPKGRDFAAREVADGISLRIIRDYDINNDRYPCRVDILYGYRTIRPELAVRWHNN